MKKVNLKKFIKCLFAATMFFIFVWLENPTCAELHINAPNNSAIWTRGGVYSTMIITGGSNPVINIINRPLSLTGVGNNQSIINGAEPILHLNGVRLSLGTATNPAGGILTADVELVSSAELRIYGSDYAIYSLKAGGPASGSITGNGTLQLRNYSFFNAVSAGTEGVSLEHLNLFEGSRLTIEKNIFADEVSIDSGNLTVVSGNAQLSRVCMH